MTIRGFNKQNISHKADLVWEWGFYLTNCKYGNYNVIIFSFNDFFVEFCINIRENKTERILALTKEELHPDYISAIKRSAPFVITDSEIERKMMVVA
jgi:hypothetical protein